MMGLRTARGKEVDQRTFKALFKDTDDGQVLKIHVFGTSGEDWQKMLDFLPSAYRCTYSEDDVLSREIPRHATIRERCNVATLLLTVDLAGASINSHFFEAESIEFDLLPREIGDSRKADLVVDVMQALSRLLAKDVFLSEENTSASEEWLKERALARVDGATGKFIFLCS